VKRVPDARPRQLGAEPERHGDGDASTGDVDAPTARSVTWASDRFCQDMWCQRRRRSVANRFGRSSGVRPAAAMTFRVVGLTNFAVPTVTVGTVSFSGDRAHVAGVVGGADPAGALYWLGGDRPGGHRGAVCGSVAWFRRGPTLSRAGDVSGAATVAQFVGQVGEAEPRPMSRVIGRFALAAGGILLAAPVVALAAKRIAEASGIDQSFLGAVLLAITTSMPQLVASLAAVRIGAHDLAVGNLFGSNAVNMSVLLLADIVYTKGRILAAVNPTQAVAAVGAILLMALAVAAIVGGTETRTGRFEPDAIVVLLAHLGVLVAMTVTMA
jgi:hypothetical protein